MTKLLPAESTVLENEADAVVVGLHTDLMLSGKIAEVNEATGDMLARLIAQQELHGKVGEVMRFIEPNGLKASRLVVVGLGDREELGPGNVGRAAGAAAKKLAATHCRQAAFYFDPEWESSWCVAGLVGAYSGCRGQDLYRTDKKLVPLDAIQWDGAAERDLLEAGVIGQSIDLTRQLINEPPSQMNPRAFADRAASESAKTGLDCEVWDQTRLEQERCGALLAVARGSAQPPCLLILKHRGNPDSEECLALVGKGVTFDSGGLSLKPSEGMKTMKCDMGGAATVLGAMLAISKLQVPLNVVGYAGLVENMVSGDSYKLGDVLTARSGTRIEVLNTDAEGRLVLADALNVAVSQGASRIVDLATLTGACLVALGLDVAGVMTNNQDWCDQVLSAAGGCGEAAWQLPMFAQFNEQIESDVADIKNVGEGRWGGAITAAKFLERFVEDRPWVHIDIAGPSFSEKPKSWLDAGGTGAFVRSLVQLARNLA